MQRLGVVAQGDAGGVTAVSSITCPVSQAVAAGHTILMAVLASTNKTLSTVTDSQSNTYTIDASITEGTAYTVYIVRCVVSSALATTDTVTCTYSGSSQCHEMIAFGYVGLVTPSSLDQITPGTTGTTGTTGSSGNTGTILQSDEIVFGVAGFGGGLTRPIVTANSPATIQGQHSVSDGSTTQRDLYALDYETSSAGVESISVGISRNTPYAVIAATYKVAASGGGGTAQTLLPGIAGTVTGSGSTGNGPAMLGVGIRCGNADVASIAASHPWCPNVNGLYDWLQIEASDNVFDWSKVQTSLQDAITNGYKSGIRISQGGTNPPGADQNGSPTWVYSANSIGAVQKVHLYMDSTDSVGYDCPVPWDPNLRLLTQRLLTNLHAFLQGSFSGTKYADVVSFLSISMPMTVGTEMTVGDGGDSRNTAAWNGVLNGQAARQAAYQQAWMDAITDGYAITSGYPLLVSDGSMWGDNMAGWNGICDWMDVTFTPSQLARFYGGPTDMRVDYPNAVSYAAWSANKDASLKYTMFTDKIQSWAQGPGISWWTQSGWKVPVLQAIQTAYLTDAVQTYGVAMMEIQPEYFGNIAGLEAWCQNTLNPAILAQQQIQRGGGTMSGNAAAYGADLKYASGTGQVILAGKATHQHKAQGPTLSAGAQTILAGMAY